MIKPKTLLGIAICVTIFSSMVLPVDGDDRTAWRLKTKEDAADAALTYTGFSGLKQYSLDSSTVQLVVLEDDQTPWLHSQINGKQLWQVGVDVNLELLVENRAGDTLRRFDQNSRKFMVYLNPETGQIIKMSSEPGYDYPHKPTKPSAEYAEDQLRRVKLGGSSEFYHGFPDMPPKVSFVEALRSVLNDPFSAHEIHALYVMHSRRGDTPRPVWIIDLRGLDPAPMTMGGPGRTAVVPVEERNHRRNGVDAMTGAHLFTTTLPQGGVMRDTTSQEDKRLNDKKP